MLKMDEKNNQISFTFSSEMKLVDMVVLQCCQFLEQQNVMRFSEFKLLLRELLINAIEHGNQNNPKLNINCAVNRLQHKRFKITVKDEGNGFDYNNLETSFPDPTELRERGYPIIHSIADNIEFNAKGNSVTAYINIEEEVNFITELNSDGFILITPTGDITATFASKLRCLLKDKVGDGHTHFRFNLSNVEDIDSIGLSTIIVLYRTLNKQNKEFELEIINASDAVKKLIQMTQLDKLYKVY